jgi:predicted ATPase
VSKDRSFITRVVLRNYKSIAACDVSLAPLTFLVGQNGTGKSNFLDALRLVAEGLRTSLDHALRERGGIHQVRRRSGGHPRHFAIRLDFRLADGRSGHYSFEVGARRKGGYVVQREECAVSGASDGVGPGYFLVEDGAIVRSTIGSPPAAAPDRLYLVNASGLPEFRLLYEQLSRMGFYNVNPDRMRDPHPPDPGEFLLRDGTNAPSVLRRMAQEDPASKRLLEEYLSKVVPGLHRVDPIEVGPQETLEFGQEVRGAKAPWQFFAKNMSDGTLRTVGLLIALFQGQNGQQHPLVPLVGIEEPETALHPAAAGVLLDGLREASQRTQVVVTSHSPDLLDDPDVSPNSILAVVLNEGTTQIGPVDDAAKSALREHLYTAGELLRLAQLSPDATAGIQPIQLKLFSGRAA